MAGFADISNAITAEGAAVPQQEQLLPAGPTGLDALLNINAEPGQPINLANSQPASMAQQEFVPPGTIPNALNPVAPPPQMLPAKMLTPEQLGAGQFTLDKLPPSDAQPIDVAAKPEQPKLELSQEVLRPAIDAFEAEKNANLEIANAAQKYAAGREAETNALINAQRVEMEKAQAEIDERISRRQKLDEESKALLARKVDPENFWNSKGTGARLLGAFSVALGEISKGMSGNLSAPNAALNIINDAIDRDVRAQEENFERDKAGVNAAYAALAEEYKDKDLRRQLYKNNLTQEFQLKIANMGAKYEGTKLGSEVKKLNAQIDQLRLAQQQKNYQDAGLNALILGDKPLNSLEVSAIEAARPQLKDRYVPQLRGFSTKSPEEVKKFSDEIIDAEGVMETAAALKDITKSLTVGGRLNPYNVDKARAKTLSQELIGKLRLSFLGPGAITDQEREALLSVIGERGDFNLFETDKTRLAKINEIVKSVETRTRARIKSLGFDPDKYASGGQQKIEQFKQSVAGLKPSK